MCSLRALSADYPGRSNFAMAEEQPSGVVCQFQEDCCVICKLGF